MKQKHPQVSDKGKAENAMKTGVLEHSTNHEGKGRQEKKIDILPPEKKGGVMSLIPFKLNTVSAILK